MDSGHLFRVREIRVARFRTGKVSDYSDSEVVSSSPTRTAAE